MEETQIKSVYTDETMELSSHETASQVLYTYADTDFPLQ